MSTDASADARETDAADYDVMLETLDTAIEEARRKVESGRVYDADNEKVRIKWIRALAYAVNVRRQVTNDRTLEELNERIEALEDSREVAP
jgi:ribosomal protein L13E